MMMLFEKFPQICFLYSYGFEFIHPFILSFYQLFCIWIFSLSCLKKNRWCDDDELEWFGIREEKKRVAHACQKKSFSMNKNPFPINKSKRAGKDGKFYHCHFFYHLQPLFAPMRCCTTSDLIRINQNYVSSLCNETKFLLERDKSLKKYIKSI